MSWLRVWSWYVIEPISVREAVNFLFFRRVFVKQAWGVMHFWTTFVWICWLDNWILSHFSCIKVNLSQSGYLNFQNFLGSMPPDPSKRPRTHGKTRKYLLLTVKPLTSTKPLLRPPPPPSPPSPCKIWSMALRRFFQVPCALLCDNWKENWDKAWSLMPDGGCT